MGRCMGQRYAAFDLYFYFFIFHVVLSYRLIYICYYDIGVRYKVLEQIFDGSNHLYRKLPGIL